MHKLFKLDTKRTREKHIATQNALCMNEREMEEFDVSKERMSSVGSHLDLAPSTSARSSKADESAMMSDDDR